MGSFHLFHNAVVNCLQHFDNLIFCVRSKQVVYANKTIFEKLALTPVWSVIFRDYIYTEFPVWIKKGIEELSGN